MVSVKLMRKVIVLSSDGLHKSNGVTLNLSINTDEVVWPVNLVLGPSPVKVVDLCPIWQITGDANTGGHGGYRCPVKRF